MCQAVDFLQKKDNLCDSSRLLFEKVRAVFPKIEEDRYISQELTEVVKLLKQFSIIEEAK
jgi:histidine ammonia-lyase